MGRHKGIKAWWIGHATVLVEMGDRWILTDPNFSNRVALVEPRRVAPGIDLDAMPEIDWVLISHAHMDHLDPPSLRRLNESARLAVPPGAVAYLPKLPFRQVAPLAPWKTIEHDGMRITAVPVRHSDGRYVIDGFFRPGGHTGYVVEHAGLTLFFAGDTGYDQATFKAIGDRFPHIDLALIPVAPARFHVLNRGRHLNPEEAMRVFDDVHARWMIPIHHSTFYFGSNANEMKAITTAICEHPRADHVFLLRPGESAEIDPLNQ